MKPTVVRCALLTVLAVVSVVAGQAQAQTWPDKPITFVVQFAAGGGTDAFARPLAAQLDAQLGKRVLIENRAGAGGTVGASAASKAAPDGYTSSWARHIRQYILALSQPRLQHREGLYRGGADRAAAAGGGRQSGQGRRQDARRIHRLRQSQSGQPVSSSASAGTTHHLAGELLQDPDQDRHPARPLSRGRPRDAGPHRRPRAGCLRRARLVGSARGGRTVRALAVAAPKRVPAFPDLPTAAEAGLAGYGVCRPGTACSPQRTRRRRSSIRWSRNCRRRCGTPPPSREPGERNGSDVPDVAGPAFAKMVSAEVERWRKVVAEANVKLD